MRHFYSYRLFWGVFFLLSTALVSAQELIPYPDNSTDVAGFMRNGLPAIDQVWTPDTYEKAFDVLFAIDKLDKYSLPRHQSPASADVFERLVAAENFAYLIDANYTLKDRVVALEQYAYLPARLMELYAEENASVERFDGEVLAIMRLSAQLTSHAVILLKELRASIGENAKRKNFQEGFNNIVKAHESSLSSMIDIFENRKNRYSSLALQDFSCHLLACFPETWAQLKTEDQIALWQRIANLSKTYPDKKIKKRLRILRKRLKKWKGAK